MSTSDIEPVLRSLEKSGEHRAARVDAALPLRDRVAVLPSAFNPPTRAHLVLLDVARGVDGVASTAAMLTTRNVDKGVYGAGFEDRVAMLLALGGSAPAVLVTNAARIVDQARALRSFLPSLGFDFVVGYDTLVRVFDQRYYDDMAADLREFFTHHRLIAANRAENGLDAVAAYLARDSEAAAFASCVELVEIPPEPAYLSSTEARREAPNGRLTRVVPPEVARYIEDHDLYR